MISDCKDLLHRSITITRRADEISKLKGENFNIFNILRIEYNEVTTHNRFLAEILNPRGKHQQGARFLELFIEHIFNNVSLSESKFRTLEKIRNEKAKVKAEYWIGQIDHKKKIGGSIDICIMTNVGQIRIENKIYASEQKDQIQRYCYNHNKEDNIVFYLTLFGKESKTAGKYEDGEDYFLLSHEDDTLTWLEACHSEAVDQPILRETLKQYIILIRKLTGQTTSKKMDKELEELILKDSKNYEATRLLSASYERARENEFNRILTIFEKELGERRELPLQRARSNRKDGGFIPLKTIEINNTNYDLGINIELENNYCFFCMIQVGGNRNAGINISSEFDEISSALDPISKQLNFSGKRNGWSLTGKYYFKNKFSFKKYLNNNRDKAIVLAIYDEIDEIIKTVLDSKKFRY